MELLNFEGLVWGRGAREGPDWARWKRVISAKSAPASILHQLRFCTTFDSTPALILHQLRFYTTFDELIQRNVSNVKNQTLDTF